MNELSAHSPIKVYSSLALILLLALALRLPMLGADLPYFYDEDEQHHFNRTVEMVQRGDFNPHYFRKPSLHFYLRMPFVAAGFLWTVKGGHAKELLLLVVFVQE